MLDSKVVESIKALSQEESTGFALFLVSPYFHKGFSVGELCQFYELLVAGIEKPENEGLGKAEIHRLVFPDKTYSEGRMDRIMFELNRLIRVFLLTKHYHREQNEVQQTLDWMGIQRNKVVSTNFEKQFQKLKKEISELSGASTERYFEQYLIAKEEHEWQSTYNKAKGDLGLPQVIETLELYHLTHRLEFLNRYLLQQRLTSLEIPEVVRLSMDSSIVPQYYLDQSPLLHITSRIHELLRAMDPSPAGFQQLMDLLKQHESELSPGELFKFYSYLRNLCTLLIEYGNPEFVEILHALQKDNLQRGYFYHEGKIQPNAVLNISMLALRVNNIGWAWEFIQAHKDRIIGENETHDFYLMNKAMCLFAEKKFDEALDTIPFGSTYSSYHLMARRLELRIYYELQSELLPNKIDAFKMFVSRAGSKTLSPNAFELLTNFGNFVFQLSQSIPGDKKRSEQLINRIQAKKLVGERAWLLEKARELGEAKKL